MQSEFGGVLVLILQIFTASAKDFFCSEDNTDVKIRGETTGRIVTLLQGESYYKNDMKCTWTLETDPDNRIQIRVESSNLQWAPLQSICDGYDHVDIREGEGLLASWCGYKFPTAINTKRNRIKIIFKTDGNNPPSYSYRGAKLVFEVFNKMSCPPNWHTNGDFCYSKKEKQSNWPFAQVECNLGQANLLSVTTEEEFNFVAQVFLNNSQDDFLWTGLNDISSPGHLAWLDLTVAEKVLSMPFPPPVEFVQCGAFRASDKRLMMKVCDRNKFPFLCKASRRNEAVLHALPKAPTDKSTDDSELGRTLRYAIPIPLGVLLAVIIISIFVYKCLCTQISGRRFRPALTEDALSPPRDVHSFEECQRHPGRRWNDRHTDDPPSYEDAINKYNNSVQL